MERTNLIFNVINTFVLITAGVLGFFLIETQNIEESKSNINLAASEMTLNQAQLGLIVSETITSQLDAEFASINEILDIAKKNGEIVLNLSQTRLNETSNELTQLQIDLKETNAKLESLSKRSSVTIDISTLINDIQPALQVSCQSVNETSLNVRCQHNNVGSHKVFLSAPTIEIFDTQTNKKIPESAYDLSGLSANTIAPGIQGSRTIAIGRIAPKYNGGYMVKISWDAQLDSSIKDAVFPLLKEILPRESLDALSEQGYTFRYTFF